jgi:hypothetical protein
MELRRMRAADLVERSVIPAEIAREVGVAHHVVLAWRKAWRQVDAFEDESGVSLLPSVRDTWAPRGQTPVRGYATTSPGSGCRSRGVRTNPMAAIFLVEVHKH